MTLKKDTLLAGLLAIAMIDAMALAVTIFGGLVGLISGGVGLLSRKKAITDTAAL